METEWIAAILARDLDTWRKEVLAFPDEASLWVTLPGVTNSAGTLTLHIAGNLSHFVGAVLGGSGYVRDRDREFGARDVPRAELLATLDAAARAVQVALGGSRPVDLDAPYPEAVAGRYRVVTGDFLMHLVSHCAFHLGQVGYLRRILTKDGISTGAVGIPSLATAQEVKTA